MQRVVWSWMVVSAWVWCSLGHADPVAAVAAPTRAEHDALVAAATPDETLVYRVVEGVELSLNVFVPAGGALREAGAARPAVVLFHGGGWRGGQPAQMHPMARYFARRGAVAFSVQYRFAEDGPPRVCVEDAKAAVRFVRAHAAAWGIDPARVIAGGGSAGGHMAAATALLPGFEDAEERAASCVPDALVLWNPVYDNGPGGYGHGRMGGEWRAYSPRHHLAATNGGPPTVVFFGDSDALVSVEAAEGFRDAQRAAGGVSELFITPGEGHAYFNRHPHLLTTLRQADAFLVAQSLLNPPG